MPNIVVIGAGVSGLTTALELSKNGYNPITVIAKHMPGDYDIEYTSPWAGANVLPMAAVADSRWERQTWPRLEQIAKDIPEAGIHKIKSLVYQTKDTGGMKSPLSEALFARDPWYGNMFRDYRKIPEAELPPYAAYGHDFGSVCINVPIYLSWLVGECLKRGVVFKRASLKQISEAPALHHLHDQSSTLPSPSPHTIVINATGLLASRLGGVMDAAVYPARGQLVLVRNSTDAMISLPICADAPNGDEMVYIMTRAAGGGTVLGGTYQKNNWDPTPDPNIALRIMERAVEVDPGLADGKGVRGLDVIRHVVGLRPCRDGGVRLEKEWMGTEGEGEPKGKGFWVVHNYGHAGWGYQGSYGCAERVLELVDGIVKETNAANSGKGTSVNRR